MNSLCQKWFQNEVGDSTHFFNGINVVRQDFHGEVKERRHN